MLGREIEGIFRIPGSLAKETLIKNAFDQSSDVDLESFPDISVHDVASVVKTFFRELDKPVVRQDVYLSVLALSK